MRPLRVVEKGKKASWASSSRTRARCRGTRRSGSKWRTPPSPSARALGDPITVYSAPAARLKVEQALAEDLFARSEIVTVHVPLNGDTRGLVNANASNS